MMLGISTFTYGWAIGTSHNRPTQAPNEQTLLDRVAAFGLQTVQFGDNWPLHELPADRLEALRQRATQEGFRLEVGARGLTHARLHQYISLAQTLNSPLLRFVIDEPGYEPTPDAVVSLLRNAVPALETARITLGIENHDRLLARQFADIVAQVNSPNVGICLDSVNSMGAGEGLAEVVQTLAPHTVNLHLKDFGIRRLSHLMGFHIDGRVAGQGMLNVPELVRQISQYRRCQSAILEQWVVPEASKPETIAKEERWAAESMAYLQKTGLFNS